MEFEANLSSFPVNYGEKSLEFDQISLLDLAKQFQTPLFVYSQKCIFESYCKIIQAFQRHSLFPLICYAVKANSNLAILKYLGELGCGFDIVSGGELLRVLESGCDPKKVVFSGVAKTEKEIEFALNNDILCFNVESSSELSRINHIAGSLNKIASISIRVNPDVDASTHEYISTGLKKNKFGVSVFTALELYQYAHKSMPNIKIKGVDCHIGSQIFSIKAYKESISKIINLIDLLEKEGIALEHIDMGGGFGVPYFQDNQQEIDLISLSEEISKLMSSKQNKLKFIIEPGRFLTANSGILLTKIEYIKCNETKNFALIDAGMNDLLRPSLYQAFHKIMEVTIKKNVVEKTYDVVGPVCETGDFLGKERKLKIEEGDYLAVLSCGAYGMSMSSNYNSRARPAEVLILNDKMKKVVQLINKREDIAEFIEKEKKCIKENKLFDF